MTCARDLLVIFALFLLGTGALFSQGDRCSTIQPFCAGDAELIFENSHSGNSNQINAEAGPDYACLGSQPYPAWFYLQVDDPGNLVFRIIQSQNADGSGLQYDVDFIVWGPFNAGDDFCSDTSLSSTNFVDCSYSPSAVETMSIPNAQANEIYVVLITNFSQAPGFISLQQTSATGSTDCSIVSSPLGPDQQVCGDEPVILDASNSRATEWEWAVYDEATDEFETIPNETEPTLTVTETGIYQVTVRSAALNDEATDEIFVEFLEIPVASTPSSSVIGCADEEGAVFDLFDVSSEMIGSNSGTFSQNFYLSQEDYENASPISNPGNFEGESGQVLLGTIVSDLTGCESEPVAITLETYAPPVIDFPEITAFCVDLNANLQNPISLGEDLGEDFIYEWNISNDPDGDGVQNPILVLESYPSQSTITLKITDPTSGCSSEYSTVLEVFSPPRNVEVEIEGSDFEGGYQLTATAVPGYGNETSYEYRLDNGEWQESPVFTGVPAGTHTIYAREINGCGVGNSGSFRLFGYPRFFTPNSDGYNDTWNVLNDGDGSVDKIYIYDRYGKLLKQINPSSRGWDGTFNNQLMPADDYWFSLEYENKETGEKKVFKGNFSLIR